jgi:hypothetical protein
MWSGRLINFSPVRLKKLIKFLLFILILLLLTLVVVFHQSVVFHGPTAAFISSYNLGRLHPLSSKSEELTLFLGSSLQTYFSKIPVDQCNTTDFRPNTSYDFWTSIEDGRETYVRSRSFLDVRRYVDGINYRTIKVLVMSQRKNMTFDNIFCSFQKKNLDVISLPTKNVEIFLSQWNPKNESGTVKPVCNDHPRDSKKVVVVQRWSLFRGSK